jgi:hypothetical protein
MSQTHTLDAFEQAGRGYNVGLAASYLTGSPSLPPVSERRRLPIRNITAYRELYEEPNDAVVTADGWYNRDLIMPWTQRLVTGFSGIEAIDSIYTEHYPGKVVITILLSNEKYDESLMDELLDREFDIQDEIPDLTMDFRYIPLLGRRRDECVSPSAGPIFESR